MIAVPLAAPASSFHENVEAAPKEVAKLEVPALPNVPPVVPNKENVFVVPAGMMYPFMVHVTVAVPAQVTFVAAVGLPLSDRIGKSEAIVIVPEDIALLNTRVFNETSP